MPLANSINSRMRTLIENASHAQSNMCWSCSSCDSECPVNIATNRLRPQKIVRLAYLGFFEELLTIPEIWYCLTCRRCSQVCPNLVKPAMLVGYARLEASRLGLVRPQTLWQYNELFRRFQRVRWHAALWCFTEELHAIDDTQWYGWLNTPVPDVCEVITHNDLFHISSALHDASAEAPPALPVVNATVPAR